MNFCLLSRFVPEHIDQHVLTLIKELLTSGLYKRPLLLIITYILGRVDILIFSNMLISFHVYLLFLQRFTLPLNGDTILRTTKAKFLSIWFQQQILLQAAKCFAFQCLTRTALWRNILCIGSCFVLIMRHNKEYISSANMVLIDKNHFRVLAWKDTLKDRVSNTQM